MIWRFLLLAVWLVSTPLSISAQCPGDNNGDRQVTVDEIVAAVVSALEGCPEPSRTPTDTAASTPSATPTETYTPTVAPINTPTSRFIDNLDGTVTDNETDLQWEKKVNFDVTEDRTNPHDVDNVHYIWAGTCSVNRRKYCQPDAASSAACFAGVEGDSTGCDECTGDDGVCHGFDITLINGPLRTVWQWLNDLNANTFAGHRDWRLPKLAELMTIVDPTMNRPAVGVAFHGPACWAACGASCCGPGCGPACADMANPTCSCTRSSSYWSASTNDLNPFAASAVDFANGNVDVGGSNKHGGGSVRAVRNAN